MLTHREARQRCAVNKMTYRQVGRNMRISFPEDDSRNISSTAYYTDDIEDAVISAGMMRRNRDRGL